MNSNQKEQAILEFSNLLTVYDLIVEEINTTGKMVRCKTLGDRKGQKSGAYFFKPDFPFNYYISNFRTGDSNKGNFKSIRGHIPVVSKTKKKHVVDKQPNYELLHETKAKLANTLFTKALSINPETEGNFQYLKNKKVHAYDIKSDRGDLLIPGYDSDGKLWMFQRILPNGSKLYISGSKKSGLFHRINLGDVEPNYADLIFVCEGYATGASIHKATKKPTVIAFDAGNLEPVGKILRQKYPVAQIVFCMDCDFAGISYGTKAAKAINGTCSLPIIPDELIQLKKNDFNDLHCLFGIEPVYKQIFEQYNNMELTVNQAHKLFKNEISLNEIDPKFHDLANKLITAYFIIDFARELIKITDTEHQIRISEINPMYREKVENELVKLLAMSYFMNKTTIEQHYLKQNIISHISDSLINSYAKKISEQDSLEERRAMLAKVNPVFLDRVKAQLDIYWKQIQLLKGSKS
ncbi:MAG: toprim domain-containing protein [Neisseriaceae bacterium]|nr:MAG: toprim domain-containing protein [Neisseriaceae bacterium]